MCIRDRYGVWFDGDWSKPRLDDPAIQKGLSDYAGLMQAGPSDILSYNWNEAGNADLWDEAVTKFRS